MFFVSSVIKMPLNMYICTIGQKLDLWLICSFEFLHPKINKYCTSFVHVTTKILGNCSSSISETFSQMWMHSWGIRGYLPKGLYHYQDGRQKQWQKCQSRHYFAFALELAHDGQLEDHSFDLPLTDKWHLDRDCHIHLHQRAGSQYYWHTPNEQNLYVKPV